MKKIILVLITILGINVSMWAQSAMKDIPSTVLEGFSQKFPDIDVKQVKWNMKDNMYKATFEENKSDYKAVFDNKGQWVSTAMDDVPMEALPGSVKEGLRKTEYGQWKISDVEAKLKPGETIYRIEVENGMKDEEVYLNQQGEVVSKDKFSKKEKKKS